MTVQNARILRENIGKLSARDQEFAQSLLNQHQRYGRLSDKQWSFVDQLAARATAPQPAATEITEGAMNAIRDLFAKASETLKRPALLVRADDTSLRLSVAGERSRYYGQIMVASEGSFHTRQWYGRIDQSGAFHPSYTAPAKVADALKAFAADPVGSATAYGQRYGVCCFCAITITDARSIDMGYGPICAKRWGLPWGGKAKPVAEAVAA